MQNADDEVILFIDVLGFASLTENYDIDLKAIRDRTVLGEFNQIFQQVNPLTKAFRGFHNSLKDAVYLAQMSHNLHAITFSDSAFIATKYLYQGVEIGIRLIQTLLSQGIPARAGIAYGSFSAVRFRSDISLDGSDHASHFLGRGVVRAYATEKCGIKGMRILLHPSASALLSDPFHNPAASAANPPVRFLECSQGECNNKVEVRHEIDYWPTGVTQEKSTWRAFQQLWDESPHDTQNHDQATAEAINRMRVSRGRLPLNRFRRRTLPR